jgi:predicted AAA+ superfamily ATPase
MIHRTISESILGMLGKYPVITLTGPRQSGKTTLLKSLFEGVPYLSLETPDVRQQVVDNPRGLFAKYGHQIILDEVQRTPEILSYIQTIVDEDPEAQFILSGSHNLLMLENISQSLAGRTALFYLLPFSLAELDQGGIHFDSYLAPLFKGYYPRIYDKDIPPDQFYPNYLETYVERDVRQVKNIGNLNLFSRFLSICAGHIGQVLNYAAIGNMTGISAGTVQNWLSVLETSFIIYRLNPYYRNFNKRITKSPKLYFYDTGLACSLLRINDRASLDTYYQKGSLFENLVINEISKYYFNQGKRPPIYYWRDSKNNELDLMIDLAGKIIPIEIKSSETYHSRFFETIKWFQEKIDFPMEKSTVIYGGDHDWETEYGKLLSWKHLKDLSSFL